MKNLEKSIIKTLCYAQIFSYPLTVSELWKYLIHHKKVTREELAMALYKNRNFLQEFREFVVLSGDLKLIKTRNERAANSRNKLVKALWVANLLSYIPTVKLIGLSGSLSMYNAKKEDDIDLFFIASRNSLWTTRFLVNVLLLILGEKRGRGEKLVKDKICPNMFMEEGNLLIKKNERSLYIAHEIAQLKILYSKDNTHSKFLNKNRWVLRYLPHAFEKTRMLNYKKEKNTFASTIMKFLEEQVFYKTQYFYMKKRITNEKISKKFAFFHPLKQKDVVDSLYKLKVKTYTNLHEDLVQKKEEAGYQMLN